MSNTQTEQLRAALEEHETIRRAIVNVLHMKADNPRNTVMNDHKIKALLQKSQSNIADILLYLKDEHALMEQEVEMFKGKKKLKEDGSVQKTGKQDPWSNFYSKLKNLKDYHNKFGTSNKSYVHPTPDHMVKSLFKPPFRPPEFSGEEAEGRFVDMEFLYQEFINIKKFRQGGMQFGGYLWYLQKFDHFHEITKNLKEKAYKPYSRYLDHLCEYLSSFFQRTQVLTDFSIVEQQIKNDFDYKWKEGTVRGWETKDLEEQRKNQFYCRACQQYFSNENTFINHHSGKRHKRNQKKLDEDLAAGRITEEDLKKRPVREKPSFNSEMKKTLAYKEHYVMSMRNLLCDIVQDSMNEVRKKQTRTIEESMAEKIYQDDPEDDLSSESEEDEPIYNPKNLPLGWDGKPIPYWLYKLHGLGIEYKCEICGNYSYWGRRAFERHFSEWRHAYGMKCLRIPNTVHFKGITSINDALVLHKKLLMDTEVNQFNPDLEEEYEDNEGNVIKKRTYMDLKRQGFIDDAAA